ncbi:aminoglycoside N(3)-acetyltransferase [Halorarum halobium]|uniref:aminoglycoside N(3)-acetyltransferase n=1 Tax=Halorarum halobium TaxID=3075121 RepID=UPI0028AD531C|nr:AAC(3) family N-acetyltransferase [Halobaculum sp. XH14]
MTEADAIDRSDAPVTADRIAGDLRALGVDAGDAVLVHASLSSLGWVPGGAPAVVDALLDVVTPVGTLAMPTHSTQLSDPSNWENPPVPDDWIAEIRETMPPYRPELTPTRMMGAVAECFRDHPEVVRSRHPTSSFAAWGEGAEAVVADHAVDPPFGETSPLARLYDLDASVLRLGVEANTSLHLAERRAEYDKSFQSDGGPMLVDGERRWVTFETVAGPDDFREIEAAYEREYGMERGSVGEATATLVDQRPLVDFGVEWMEANR